MIDIKLILEYTKDIDLLYVEDNESLRESTLKLLENFFDHIEVAEDGLIALNKYKERFESANPYDLILSDINMPNMTGLEMAEEIITIEPRQSIVFVTAHNEIEYLHKAIKVGVDSFLLKPLKLQELSSVLFKVCRAVSDKKFVAYYYDMMEARNIELENEIKKLKEQIQGTTTQTTLTTNKIELPQLDINSIVEDYLADLQDIKVDINFHMDMLRQNINDLHAPRDILFKISLKFEEVAKIFDYYLSLDTLNSNLRELNGLLVESNMPVISDREELFKALQKMIDKFGELVNLLETKDLATISNVLEYLDLDITTLTTKWKDCINVEEVV